VHLASLAIASTATGLIGGAVATTSAASGVRSEPRLTHSQRSPSSLTREAMLADPPKCLKRAGLGHIRSIGSDTWQGTIGEEPTSKINDSVFVEGPYASIKAASNAAEKASIVQIAYDGGRFIATASRVSYLQQETSYAAACLVSLTEPSRYKF